MQPERRAIPILRSVLFVPAMVEKYVQRAPDTQADVICLDLEDSVPPAQKEEARAAAAEAVRSLRDHGQTVFVRVNGLETDLLEGDLNAVVRSGLRAIALPKAHGPEVIARAEGHLERLERERGMEPGAVGIMPLVETAEGVLNAQATAKASPRIVALSLGAEDLRADVGLERGEDAYELDWPRAQVSHAAAAGGVVAVDTPEPDYGNPERLETDAQRARRLGFRGKYCIHPSQVETVNRVFSPTREEITEANEIVRLLENEGAARGRGAVAANGRMIDTPMYWQAKRILAWAEAAGMSTKE